jgi:hypothetical protein
MDRTLFCLLVSMTLGAMILNWTQPERPAHHRAPAELTAVIPDRWYAISVIPLHDNERGNEAASHFLVDRDGRRSATEPWTAQRRFGSIGMVRIGLVAPPGSQEVSRPQRAAAEALVQELRDRCDIPGERVFWDDTLIVPPPLPTPANARPTISASPTAS